MRPIFRPVPAARSSSTSYRPQRTSSSTPGTRQGASLSAGRGPEPRRATAGGRRPEGPDSPRQPRLPGRRRADALDDRPDPANASSNASSGIQTHQLAARAPKSCSGSATTTRREETTPSQAIHAGIIRPRRRSQAKMVLPTAKKMALTLAPPPPPAGTRRAPAPPRGPARRLPWPSRARAAPASAGCRAAPLTPSTTRQTMAVMARSRIFVARQRPERHAQRQGAEAGEQVEQDDDAHVRRVQGHVRELGRDPLPGGRPAPTRPCWRDPPRCREGT